MDGAAHRPPDLLDPEARRSSPSIAAELVRWPETVPGGEDVVR